MRYAWPMSRLQSMLVLAVAGAAFGGCRMTASDTVTIGNQVTVAGMQGPEGHLTLDQARTLSGPPNQIRLDRSDWEPIEFVVPVDSSPHRPTFVTAWWMTDTARSEGLYPTPLSALELPGGSDKRRLTDAGRVGRSVASDLLHTPYGIYREFRDDGWPGGGFTTYQRERKGRWLGEALGVASEPRTIDMPGVEPTRPPAPQGEPGVIRRYGPTPATPSPKQDGGAK